VANDVARLIRRYSRQFGVDPRAALAVAMGEGGLRWGAVGDQGTSYGPFQLHVGGALPAGKGPGWANSPAGIRYAIRKMAEAGARGLTGQAAINAIVRQFERPADPDSSVRNALARYGSIGPGALGANGRRRRQPAGRAGAPGQSLSRQGALMILQQVAQTGKVDPVGLLNLAAEFRANETGGTTAPPVTRRGGAYKTDNKTVNTILAAAHAQIGKPYVWGGESPGEGGFDCSGLIDWAYRQAGIDLPGRLTTRSAMKVGYSVKGKKLQPGDMVIMKGIGHMVMYVGGGKVIAAPRRGEPVQYQPLSRFRGDIADIRRLL
jgi:cell wall-associated NlpC family hydrolase